jgi:WD repeat-containing protein 35
LLKTNPVKFLHSFFFSVDNKSLRDTENILKQVGFADAFQYVEDNPHTKLWNYLAEISLNDLNFKESLKCFVKAQDYAAIKFTKQLEVISVDPRVFNYRIKD